MADGCNMDFIIFQREADGLALVADSRVDDEDSPVVRVIMESDETGAARPRFSCTR